MAIRSILALFLVLAPGTAAGGLPSTGMLLDGVGTPEKSTDRMEGRLKVTSRVYPAGGGPAHRGVRGGRADPVYDDVELIRSAGSGTVTLPKPAPARSA